MNWISKAQSSLDSEDHKDTPRRPRVVRGPHFAERCCMQFFTTLFYRRVEVVFLKFETVKVNTSFT